MKNFLLVISLFTRSGLSVKVQTELSLKVTSGEIGRLISEEQKQNVKNLVLEGE